LQQKTLFVSFGCVSVPTTVAVVLSMVYIVLSTSGVYRFRVIFSHEYRINSIVRLPLL